MNPQQQHSQIQTTCPLHESCTRTITCTLTDYLKCSFFKNALATYGQKHIKKGGTCNTCRYQTQCKQINPASPDKECHYQPSLNYKRITGKKTPDQLSKREKKLYNLYLEKHPQPLSDRIAAQILHWSPQKVADIRYHFMRYGLIEFAEKKRVNGERYTSFWKLTQVQSNVMEKHP